jgi:hypothetical protein
VDAGPNPITSGKQIGPPTAPIGEIHANARAVLLDTLKDLPQPVPGSDDLNLWLFSGHPVTQCGFVPNSSLASCVVFVVISSWFVAACDKADAIVDLRADDDSHAVSLQRAPVYCSRLASAHQLPPLDRGRLKMTRMTQEIGPVENRARRPLSLI